MSANSALRGSLDGDRQSSAEQLATCHTKISELEQAVSQLQSTLEEKEREAKELSLSRRQLEESLGRARETLQHSEAAGHSEAERLTCELTHLKEETREKLSALEESLRVAVSERDTEKSRAAEVDAIRKTLAEASSEREKLVSELVKVESQLNKTNGALEFAESEMRSKSSVIQNLSQLLEEKKSTISELNTEVSSAKGDGATKLTEVLQKNEELLRRNSALESDLGKKESVLQRQEAAAEELKRQMEKLQESISVAEERMQSTRGELKVVERERQTSITERERLCGKVDTLAQSRRDLEEKFRQDKEKMAQLEGRVAELSSQVSDLQKNLQTAQQQANKSVKELKDYQLREESLRSELDRAARENVQMKQQFDSALSLMESKAAEQTQLLRRSKEDAESKYTEISRLKQQAVSNSKTMGDLRERVTKSEADCKISGERCRLLERDGEQLRGRVGELEMALNQREAEVGDARAEKETLTCEHRTLLSGMQEHETRVLQLTNQVAELAREKEGEGVHSLCIVSQVCSASQFECVCVFVCACVRVCVCFCVCNR